MPQALLPLCLIHFLNWQNSPFSLLALWGNKKWSPSMKVQQMENWKNKMGLKGCKWSSLKVPGIQYLLSDSFLELRKLPFVIIVGKSLDRHKCEIMTSRWTLYLMTVHDWSPNANWFEYCKMSDLTNSFNNEISPLDDTHASNFFQQVLILKECKAP